MGMVLRVELSLEGIEAIIEDNNIYYIKRAAYCLLCQSSQKKILNNKYYEAGETQGESNMLSMDPENNSEYNQATVHAPLDPHVNLS
jgi:hypothetical protein